MIEIEIVREYMVMLGFIEGFISCNIVWIS